MNPIVMILLLLSGFGAFGWSACRRWKLLRIGAPAARFDRIGERLAATWRFAFAQKRMHRYRWAGLAHQFIFLGFVVLLLRSLILFARGFISDPHFGYWLFDAGTTLGNLYALLKDVFAVLVIFGVLVFFYYRVVKRLPRMTLSGEGLVILGIIFVMMVADIAYDGATLALQHSAVSIQLSATPPSPPSQGGAGGDHSSRITHDSSLSLWEPAGSVAAMILDGLSPGALHAVRHLGYWTHVSLVLIFLNLLPYSKHFHIITAVPNVFLQNLDPPGRLEPIRDLEGKVERGETLGVARIEQFTWKGLLDTYTCTECGRCSDNCPATRTGKMLSPKHFMLDLRDHLYSRQEEFLAASRTPHASGGPESSHASTVPAQIDLVGAIINPEVIWACTTCRACEEECPVFISYVDKFIDLRRHLVQEKGEFPGDLQSAFRGMENAGNPWGLSAEDRLAWAKGIDVPLLADKADAEYLFWVGCAPAYDERARKIARATAQLLNRAGVSYAVLGPEETCNGDPARRAGNEFLFQMLAQSNCETLNARNVKKIVTVCPHCFNTLANEYPDFGGKFEVIHHSQLLARLVREGRLNPRGRVQAKVVYHDACYLGRYNGVYDDPRAMLRSIPGVELVEAADSRDRGMCCGAGGAQMFKEEEKGLVRVNIRRTEQLLEALEAPNRPNSETAKPDGRTIASACPFCMRMLTDALGQKDRDDVKQLDIAEVLLCSVATGN